MREDRITTHETAKLLGLAPMTVSLWLRSGECPFGSAIKKGPGKWTYILWRKEVMEYAERKGVKNNAEQ